MNNSIPFSYIKMWITISILSSPFPSTMLDRIIFYCESLKRKLENETR